MFKGIVQATGKVTTIEALETTRRVSIEAPDLVGALSPGDSVAVDGACLTAVSVAEDCFVVDVIGPTLERTISGGYQEGARVNLELALKFGAPVDGHLVQGHIDAVGYLIQSQKDGEFWMMDFRLPAEVHNLTVSHGSIAINGVSLTVSELRTGGVCRIGVIPFTYAHTNLGDLEPEAPVNVEGDLIGKYVAKILATRGE